MIRPMATVKYSFLSLLTLFSLSSLSALASQTYQPYQTLNPYGTSQQSLEKSILTVPAGECIPASTNAEINTHFLILGQSVSLLLAQDYYYNNKLVAPVGSSINGTVIQVKNKKTDKEPSVQLKFTNIISPYGPVIPISAQVKTHDETGIIKTDSKIEAITSNKDGDIVIPANSNLTLELMQPITINTANEHRY